ncbi:retropepsin-like aspartic protease [Neobacillus niacini]|uniref:retropepsin-like aspartic protease n=1 Tax=Neobacillus niacini TaxID=86668 RepID=UPI0021CB45B5|nr:retropepsin-like aspartic protease [Neobacillus niacini]MCM3764482.1 retropepsin-like domain-containing protein [Neobacillus niacini]
MKLELINQLLESQITICYNGQTKVIDKLIIDTGAAHTIISSDIVDDLGIRFENGDQLVSAFGIGGEEYSFRKAVGSIKLGDFEIKDIKLDFGDMNDWDINGLIGLDILIGGKFIIDLGNLELVQI